MLMSWRKCSRDMTRTEFEHISVLIRGRIVALARRFARAADLPDPAEDIAQETLEALWRLCEKGYPVRDPEALAVKIAKNICVMHYRRRRIVPDSIGGMDFEGGFPATERTDMNDIVAVRERLYATLSGSIWRCGTGRECPLTRSRLRPEGPSRALKSPFPRHAGSCLKNWKRRYYETGQGILQGSCRPLS